MRVACIGECMVELAHIDQAAMRMAFGGDTSNTAVYLARLTQARNVHVDYVTALGDDAYSKMMLAFWKEEGVGTGLITRLPGRMPGLYIIRTDERGERSFTYWRGEAAARDLLRDGRGARLREELTGYDLVYLSGITLSILNKAQRLELLSVLDRVRDAGGGVAFDSNFRPAGWPDADEARRCFEDVLQRTDIALPTLDDEQALFGEVDQTKVASNLHELGVAEVVVKLGASGCFLSIEGKTATISAVRVDDVIDSTAAGDSFNAGYLASRLLGMSPEDSARAGHRVAGEVIRHRGAVIPIDAVAEIEFAS